MPNHKNEELLPYYEKLAKMIYWKDDLPYWKVRPSTAIRLNALAGNVDNNRRRIRISGKNLLSYRLRIYMETGSLPPEDVDHINHDSESCSLSEITCASSSDNNRNARKRPGCSSDYIGVSWYTPRSKWKASARDLNGKKKYLGIHTSEIDAARARDSYLDSLDVLHFVRNFPK